MSTPINKTPKQWRNLIHQPHRDAWLEIDLGALEQNARTLKTALFQQVNSVGGQAPALMAVVKADAYGHGAVMTAPILQACGFKQLGVASIDEALQLRQAGIEMPILVLSASPLWAMPLASQHNIQLTIFDKSHLDAIKQQKTPLQVQVKIDTGMHRIGVAWEAAGTFLTALNQLPQAQLTGVFSHFARGDHPATCTYQWQRFATILTHPSITTAPNIQIHIANSLGGFNCQEAWQHCTLARMGIGLYGYELSTTHLQQPLQPVMGLKARFSHIQQVPANEGVSYNHTYTTSQTQWLGTIPLGYADGLARRLSNQLVAQYQGITIPQVGMITMDQTIFDVSAVVAQQGKPPALGDTITLLETGIPPLTNNTPATQPLTLSKWASTLNTIEYELMCALRVRLPRIYTRSGV
jgi:alanine racemase